MSYYSSMNDLCVSPGECPPGVHVFSDITPFYSDDEPSACAYSRPSAAAQQVSNLVGEYDVSALSYLYEVAVMLNSQKVEEAIEGMERLFSQMQSQPERAAACSLGDCSAQEVTDALEVPEEAPIPDRLCDDEGEGLPYVIAYLKAHMFVLRYARRNGFYLLHGKSHYLDGSEAI